MRIASIADAATPHRGSDPPDPAGAIERRRRSTEALFCRSTGSNEKLI
jgi:hypothetical protein